MLDSFKHCADALKTQADEMETAAAFFAEDGYSDVATSLKELAAKLRTTAEEIEKHAR